MLQHHRCMMLSRGSSGTLVRAQIAEYTARPRASDDLASTQCDLLRDHADGTTSACPRNVRGEAGMHVASSHHSPLMYPCLYDSTITRASLDVAAPAGADSKGGTLRIPGSSLVKK